MKEWIKRTNLETLQEINNSVSDSDKRVKVFYDYLIKNFIQDRKLSEEDLKRENNEPNITNLTEAVLFVKDCVQKGEPITIIGDYDCDGITSSAILKLGLNEYTGVKPEVIIPRRMTDGYGVNKNIIDKVPCGLIICVDNGISAIEAIDYAKEKSIKVIILDHHIDREDGRYPNADVIVDPCTKKYASDYKYYCGAGLAYRFIKELNPETQIMDELISLAGIGTVADVMTLKGHNRWLVYKALENIADRKVPFGLKLLLDVLDINEYITEEDIGFTIGPCFNAPGRLYDDGGQQMVNFITADDRLIRNQNDLEICIQEAEQIKSINEERKAEVLSERRLADSLKEDNEKIIIIENDNFKKGIVGIVAGQYTEEYGIPSLIATRDTKNPKNFSGSGRAPENLHLKELLDKANEYIVGYGGHSGAAGFTVAEKDWDSFVAKVKGLLKDYEPDNANKLYYDIELDGGNIDFIALWKAMRKIAPFGEGNNEIVFRINKFLGTPFIMGKQKQHFKLVGGSISALGFSMADKWIAEGKPTYMDIIGTLSLNFYKGNISPQIKIIDFKKSEEEHTQVYNDLASMFTF